MSPALALGLILATAAGAKTEDPVAVMPFKNLNQDPAHDWLKLGIAETMVADLRRGGKLRVVERDQIDQAMAELALQGNKGSEESTAARVGKMVGARTILVGSFQQVGGQVRIVARFVAVETGVVVDAVKLTGPMQKILALQDQIVAKLLGDQAPKAERPARRTEPKVVKAYQLYAMSLGTASDAERVGYLKQALEADPEFTYAADDLLALERRMRGYAEQSQRRMAERGRTEADALFSGEGTPQERAQRVYQLLALHQQGFRYRALLRDAQRVLELDLPAAGMMNPGEYASYCVFLAYTLLNEPDKALQAGEKHLNRFAGGQFDQALQMKMQHLIDQRLQRERGPEIAKKELEEIERERAEVLASPRPATPIRLRNFDLRRCVELSRAWQFRRTIDECHGFAEKYRAEGETDPQIREQVLIARYYAIGAHAELGEFDRARELAARLTETDGEFARKMALPTVVQMWPRD